MPVLIERKYRLQLIRQSYVDHDSSLPGDSSILVPIFPQKKGPWYQPTEDDCVQAAVKCQTMNRTHEGLNSYWQ